MTHRESRMQQDAIIRDLKDGMEVAEVAKKYDRSIKYVMNLKAKEKITGAEFGQKMPLAGRSYRILAALINTDQPLRDIAKDNLVSRAWVYDIKKKAEEAGIKVKHRAVEKGRG